MWLHTHLRTSHSQWGSLTTAKRLDALQGRGGRVLVGATLHGLLHQGSFDVFCAIVNWANLAMLHSMAATRSFCMPRHTTFLAGARLPKRRSLPGGISRAGWYAIRGWLGLVAVALFCGCDGVGV